mmetsp:Transcript_16078/g.18003  ORF Transcript_16078/g.18003 Transcript_16078/m.18003 type:complete len:638 (-) Transcript_16078:898-2811(-)
MSDKPNGRSKSIPSIDMRQLGESKKIKKCQKCEYYYDINKLAKFRCQQCDYHLCYSCHRKHLIRYKGHKIEEYQITRSNGEELTEYQCALHNKPLEYYCLSTNSLMCLLCFKQSKHQAGNKVLSVDQAFDTILKRQDTTVEGSYGQVIELVDEAMEDMNKTLGKTKEKGKVYSKIIRDMLKIVEMTQDYHIGKIGKLINEAIDILYNFETLLCQEENEYYTWEFLSAYADIKKNFGSTQVDIIKNVKDKIQKMKDFEVFDLDLPTVLDGVLASKVFIQNMEGSDDNAQLPLFEFVREIYLRDLHQRESSTLKEENEQHQKIISEMTQQLETGNDTIAELRKKVAGLQDDNQKLKNQISDLSMTTTHLKSTISSGSKINEPGRYTLNVSHHKRTFSETPNQMAKLSEVISDDSQKRVNKVGTLSPDNTLNSSDIQKFQESYKYGKVIGKQSEKESARRKLKRGISPSTKNFTPVSRSNSSKKFSGNFAINGSLDEVDLMRNRTSGKSKDSSQHETASTSKELKSYKESDGSIHMDSSPMPTGHKKNHSASTIDFHQGSHHPGGSHFSISPNFDKHGSSSTSVLSFQPQTTKNGAKRSGTTTPKGKSPRFQYDLASKKKNSGVMKSMENLEAKKKEFKK